MLRLGRCSYPNVSFSELINVAAFTFRIGNCRERERRNICCLPRLRRSGGGSGIAAGEKIEFERLVGCKTFRIEFFHEKGFFQ